jgi:NADH-quinone oxidoreductase subunit N
MSEIERVALAARIFTIAALTSLAVLSGSDTLPGALVVIVVACAAFVLSRWTDASLATVAALEGAVVAVLAVATYPTQETVTPYLVIPALIGALACVLSAGIFIFGISYVYGFAGSTRLSEIATAIAGSAPAGRQMLLTGLIFIIAAFGFKVSAVPFHFWAPDTYEGSPTPLAAFLSVASKAAGFVGLLLVLLIGFPALSDSWAPLVGGIAIATMTLGNVLALRQNQIVRLLAYSSIAQAGYMLIPIALIAPHEGIIRGSNAQLVRSLVTYLAVYTLMNLGAFAVVIGLSKQYPALLFRDIAGLARRAPLAALALAGFLISLGGIPPFAGWFAKFVVFQAAVQRGSGLGVVLAVAMVLNSVISLYYYVGVVRAMYMQTSDDETAVRLPRPIAVAIGVAFVGVVGFGVYPEPFARLANAARLVLAG